VELSHRCRYLEVYMITSGPIWTKFDNLTHSSTQMTEVATAKKCNMAEVCFFKPFYLSLKLRCVDEIWSVDRL